MENSRIYTANNLFIKRCSVCDMQENFLKIVALKWAQKFTSEHSVIGSIRSQMFDFIFVFFLEFYQFDNMRERTKVANYTYVHRAIDVQLLYL